MLNTCCEWIALLARWMVPFMPGKAEALWGMLGQRAPASATGWPALPSPGRWRTLEAGTRLGEVLGLFAKVDSAADVDRQATVARLAEIRREFVSQAQLAIDPRRYMALREMNEIRLAHGLAPQSTGKTE